MRAQNHLGAPARGGLGLGGGEHSTAQTRAASVGPDPEHVHVAGSAPRPPGQAGQQLAGGVVEANTDHPAIPELRGVAVEAVDLLVQAAVQSIVGIRDGDVRVVHGLIVVGRAGAVDNGSARTTFNTLVK